MNKNTGLGLGILVAVVIIAGLLWWLYPATSPQVGPAPVATSKPEVPPGPKAPPPAAATEPKPEAPVAPPITTEPPQAVPPLQEPGPAVKIPPPPEMKEHFGILVGEYRNYQDASKLMAKLKKQGKPAFVQRDPQNPNNFQVWVGPFSSQEEAQATEKDLQTLFKKPLKIERIENPVPK